jgi:hypothetical protein
VVEGVILPAVNAQLQVLWEKANTQRKYYKPLTYEGWIRFYLSYMLENLANKGLPRGKVDRSVALRTALLGKKRYDAIFSASQLSTEQLFRLRDALSAVWRQNFNLGSEACCDEQLWAYRGRDMEQDGVSMKIPHKPHPYGVVCYTVAMVLLWSLAPIAVDMEPRLVGNIFPPADLAETMLKRLSPHLPYGLCVTLDSAFCAKKLLAALQVDRVLARIAVTGSAQSGYDKEAEAMGKGLITDLSRTVKHHHVILQVIRKPDRLQSVATNAYKIPHAVAEAPPSGRPRLNYEAAVALYEKTTAAELMSVFGPLLESDPPSNPADAVEVMKLLTGVDVHLPPPTSRGPARLTVGTLGALSKTQLLALHRRTPRCSGSDSKNKEQLIGDILRNHPRGSAADEDRDAEDVHLDALRESVVGAPHAGSPLVDSYNSTYNWIDQIDNLYYESMEPAHHGNYLRLYFFSMLFNSLVNARGAYIEAHYCRLSSDGERKRASSERRYEVSVCDFIMAAVGRILEE